MGGWDRRGGSAASGTCGSFVRRADGDIPARCGAPGASLGWLCAPRGPSAAHCPPGVDGTGVAEDPADSRLYNTAAKLQNVHWGSPGESDLGTAWLPGFSQSWSTSGVGFPGLCCNAGANCSRHGAMSRGRSLRWLCEVPTAAGWPPAQPLSALCLRSAVSEHKAEASPAANPGLKAKTGFG